MAQSRKKTTVAKKSASRRATKKAVKKTTKKSTGAVMDRRGWAKAERPKLFDWIAENQDGYDNRMEFMRACEKESGYTMRSIEERMRQMRHSGDLTNESLFGDAHYRQSGARLSSSNGSKKKWKCKISSSEAVDVDVIKSEYDDEGRIEEGLEKLERRMIKDNDFRVALDIAHGRWKVASLLEKFSKNKIELEGKFRGTYWGQEEVIEELRQSVDML